MAIDNEEVILERRVKDCTFWLSFIGGIFNVLMGVIVFCFDGFFNFRLNVNMINSLYKKED